MGTLKTRVTTLVLVGALSVVGAPQASAALPGQPEAVPGSTISIAGSKLSLFFPERLLIPVTLPKFTIPNLADGSAAKPRALVQFRWRLCKKPVLGENAVGDCFIMATPTVAEGRRAYVNIDVNFTQVGNEWTSQPVRVPFDPRNLANVGQDMYLTPLASVAAVRADGADPYDVGRTEFQPSPQTRGVEIAASLTAPFNPASVTLSSDKQSYAPTDRITLDLKVPAVDFRTVTGQASLRLEYAISACPEPVAEPYATTDRAFYAGGVTVNSSVVTGNRALYDTCQFVNNPDVPADTVQKDENPFTTAAIDKRFTVQASALLRQPLEPGQSTTVYLAPAAAYMFTSLDVVDAGNLQSAANSSYRLSTITFRSTIPITISVPADGQRVEAQPQAAPVENPLIEAAPSGSSGANTALAAVGVDLTRAPLGGTEGKASTATQALSVKVSKKPKRGKKMTITGTAVPKPEGSVTYALVYSLAGTDVVVRSKTVTPKKSKSSVKWKLKKSDPKGKYTVYASYTPTDSAKLGISVSRQINVR